MSTVNCSNPRIILNPKVPELLLRYKMYRLNGILHKNSSYNIHPYDFNYHLFSPKFNHITIDNYDQHVIIDPSTGETFNMYLCVPCGHCDICKVSKINSFVKRCEYESQMYNSMPWFCTLTYAKEPDEGVSVRDCQLFLKRFRINLKRAGFDWLIRYVLVAEYGKKTHRAHYHAIFWNINSFTHDDFVKVQSILEKSWHHGFVRSRQIDMKDDKGFYYTSKYLKKDCFVPKDKNGTFVLSSRKNGGIGAPFIDKHSSRIRKSLNTSYSFLNKWTGKVENFMWSTYVINRIFPSFYRSVDRLFRNAVYDFMYYFYYHIFVFPLWAKDFYNFEIDLRNRIKDYLFIPVNFEHFSPRHGQFSLTVLENLKHVIEERFERIDFVLSKRLDYLRSCFLSRLFKYSKSVDLVARSRQCSDILSWHSDRTFIV